MNFWADKRVIVTGGHGFLGQHVVEKLQSFSCKEIVAPRSREFDLRDVTAIRTLLTQAKPHVLIHLAAICGGIEANRQRPGTFFYDNAIMGVQLIEQARLHGIQKTVVLGTVCAYPKHTSTPFKEDDIWNGYPEETNAPYGLAKKMLLVQLQAYRDQYSFPGIYLLPVNLYGPRDNFDLTTSHVIPAMIRKMIEAREKGASELSLWGTGNVSREFLFAGDCAEGILLAAEKYNKSLPVNLGTGNELMIRDLASLIAKLTGYPGKILWDSTKPDGQPKRRLDTTRAEQEFGFKAKTTFETGLKKTIDWYLQNQKSQK
jgi:GDP-L-fucose synthase